MAESDLIVRKRISAKNFLPGHLGLLLLAVIVWAGGAKLGSVSAPILFFVGLTPLALGLLYAWLVRISTEYRLYEDSLEIESGIIARSIDNVQLFRVRDVGMAQSLLGRMLNVGNVHLTSTDQSAPHLMLRGIDEPRALYEQIRELIKKSQAARRTMIVEEELGHTALADS